MNRLKQKLETEVWNTDSSLPIDEKFNIFHNNIKDLVNHFLPVTDRLVCSQSPVKETMANTWYNEEHRKCKQLYHKMLKNNCQEKKQKYTEYNLTLQKSKDMQENITMRPNATTRKPVGFMQSCCFVFVVFFSFVFVFDFNCL